MDDQEGLMSPLIHIGAAKAASTWMQAQVFSKEDLGFKELATREDQKSMLVRPSSSAFDASAASVFFASLTEQAEAQGMCPVISVERLSGSSRFGDKDAMEFADRLHSVFPNAKILYVVREQGSMWRAQYLQYIRRGGHKSLKWFLDQNGEGSAYFHWDRFKYDALVHYHQKLFGTERVLVLPLEMLASEPRLFFSRLRVFCNLPTQGAQNLPAVPAKRQSTSSLSYAVVRKLNLLPVLRSLLGVQSEQSSANAKTRLRNAAQWVDQKLPMIWKVRYQARIDRLIAKRLGSYYANSNTALHSDTGLDLLRHGYVLDG